MQLFFVLNDVVNYCHQSTIQ